MLVSELKGLTAEQELIKLLFAVDSGQAGAFCCAGATRVQLIVGYIDSNFRTIVFAQMLQCVSTTASFPTFVS